MDDRPRDYREEELRRALAADPGIGELELDVRIDRDQVIIAGVLPTEERREAVHQVIGALAPDLQLVDDTTTPRFVPADQEERIG